MSLLKPWVDKQKRKKERSDFPVFLQIACTCSLFSSKTRHKRMRRSISTLTFVYLDEESLSQDSNPIRMCDIKRYHA